MDQLFGSPSLSGDQDRDVCFDSDTEAIMDFDKGVVCGKRDSRVYYNAKQPPTFTNPGGLYASEVFCLTFYFITQSGPGPC